MSPHFQETPRSFKKGQCTFLNPTHLEDRTALTLLSSGPLSPSRASMDLLLIRLQFHVPKFSPDLYKDMAVHEMGFLWTVDFQSFHTLR